MRLCVVAAAPKASQYTPSNAKEAVERGLAAFKDSKDYDEAERLFRASMALNPSSQEGVAALYNLGCAYAKQQKWQQAADAISRAVNEYDLKLSVALQDADLRELRDSREWMDMMTTVRGGLSRGAKINLRTEARAPFRFARLVIFGSLAAGAGLGLLVILGRLAGALQGGEGAPDLGETLQNLGVNSAALAVLAFLLVRELSGREKDVAVTEREEQLGRLLVKLVNGRLLPLIRFRGAVRPVIVAGDKSFVDKAVRAAELVMVQLRARGVSVVPVVYGTAVDPEERLKALKRELRREGSKTGKGFGGASATSSTAAAAGGADSEEGTDEAASSSSGAAGPSPVGEADKRWRLEPALMDEWEAWVEAQKEFAGLDASKRNCWVQVQLDGTVARSGLGAPSWEKLVGLLPPLGTVQTTMTDGIGTDV